MTKQGNLFSGCGPKEAKKRSLKHLLNVYITHINLFNVHSNSKRYYETYFADESRDYKPTETVYNP